MIVVISCSGRMIICFPWNRGLISIKNNFRYQAMSGEESMQSMDSIDTPLQPTSSIPILVPLDADDSSMEAVPSGTPMESDTVSIDPDIEATSDSAILASEVIHDPLADSEATVTVDGSSVPVPEKKTLNRIITEDVTYRVTEPKDIVEYEWPVKSGEKWMIQEQISELVNIKGFKRKYPEMTGRQIKKEEKEYLVGTHKVNTLLSELHMQFMTALRATEVHDMLSRDYPGVHSEYQRISTEKMKERMAEQQKEMDLVKQDPALLEELRQKAMKSAREYNSELQLYKKNERQSFWDLQTSILQSSKNKWKVIDKELTRPSPYPVALIHGQFQHYYKKYTPEECRRLPLGTVLDGERLFPVYREASPPPITVKEGDIVATPVMENNEVKEESDLIRDPLPHPSNVLSSVAPLTLPNLKTPKEETNDKSLRNTKIKVEEATPRQTDTRRSAQNQKCSTCGAGKPGEAGMLRCSTCSIFVHAECSDMGPEMVSVVSSYDWNCMDCKKCTECTKPDNEEALLFCDRCDRGYHTYCVGLTEPPNGEWKCSRFCSTQEMETDVKPLSTVTPSRRGGKRTVAMAN